MSIAWSRDKMAKTLHHGLSILQEFQYQAENTLPPNYTTTRTFPTV